MKARTLPFLVCLVVLLSTAGAQDLDVLAPPELEVPQDREVELGIRERETAARGEGAVLMPHISQVEVRGESLGKPPGRELLAAFEGGPLTEGDLAALAEGVLAHYENRGFPVVDVWVPEADPASGKLVVEAAAGTVGDVLIAPGQFFSGAMLGRRISLEPGSPVRLPSLESQLSRLGGNPFRSVQLLASPGEAEGEVDLLFQVEDRRPWRVFAGYENTGTDAIGADLFFAGFNLGNLWGLDHQLSYQFTLAGEGYEVSNGHAFTYRAPLPFWGATLKLDGAYGDVDVSLPHIESAAVAWEGDAAIEIPLPRLAGISHSVSLGAGFGRSEYDIGIDGIELPEVTTDRFLLTGNYTARRGETAVSLDAGYSPGGLSSDNTDAAFGEVREGASASYFRGEIAVRHRQPLPLGAALVLRASGQWADGALPPSEQIALGGASTVRGYSERVLLGDSGAFANAELHAPPISVSQAQTTFLAFVDWGTISLENGDNEDLASAGTGVRLAVADHIDLRFDYGWSLDGAESRGHVGIFWSF